MAERFEAIGSVIEWKCNGARSVSWKSEGQERISQGLLIWWVIILICAADWLALMCNFSPDLWLVKAWAKPRALIGQHQWVFRACNGLSLDFVIHIMCTICTSHIIPRNLSYMIRIRYFLGFIPLEKLCWNYANYTCNTQTTEDIQTLQSVFLRNSQVFFADIFPY